MRRPFVLFNVLIGLGISALAAAGLLFFRLPFWFAAVLWLVAALLVLSALLFRRAGKNEARIREAATESSGAATATVSGPAGPKNAPETGDDQLPVLLREFAARIEDQGIVFEQSFPPLEDRLKRAVQTFYREESSRKTEEIKKNFLVIQDNIGKAFDISDNLSRTAKEAFDLSEEVQDGVRFVIAGLLQTQKFSETLSDQSHRIAKILSLMSDIAEKTHILSINASIVSARTGIHGKGFEVVAREIRKLAEQTDRSLADITDVVKATEDTLGHIVTEVRQTAARAESEKKSLMNVAGSLQGLVLAVEIIRTVAGLAKDKSQAELQSIESLVGSFAEADKSAFERDVQSWLRITTQTLADSRKNRQTLSELFSRFHVQKEAV